MRISFRDERKVDYYLNEFDVGSGILGFHIQADMISYNSEIPDLTSFDEKSAVVWAALRRYRGYKKHSLSLFRKALQTELRKRVQQRTTFQILMFLNADYQPSSQYSLVQSLGNEFYLLSWDDLRTTTNLNLPKMWHELSAMFLPAYDQGFWQEYVFTEFYIPAYCRIQANTPDQAVSAIEKSFDAFRAALNIQGTLGRLSLQAGYPSPLADVLSSPCFVVFDGDGAYKLFHFTTSARPRRKKSISDERVKQAIELVGSLWPQTDENDIRNLIADVLLRYGRALDYTDWQETFMHLWRTLEIATLQNVNNINMKTVCKRTSSMIRKPSYLQDLLPCLLDIRNKLVHGGEFPTHLENELRLVQYLKIVVETVIRFLLGMMQNLPSTQSLEKYYQAVPLSNTDLERQRDVAALILDTRENTPS